MCDVSGLDQDTACILTRMPEANVKHQPHRLLLLFPGEIRPKLVESEAFLIGLIGISTLHRYDYNLMAIRQLHVVVLTGVEMFMILSDTLSHQRTNVFKQVLVKLSSCDGLSSRSIAHSVNGIEFHQICA